MVKHLVVSLSLYFQFDLGLALSLKKKNFQKKTIWDNFELAGESVVPPSTISETWVCSKVTCSVLFQTSLAVVRGRFLLILCCAFVWFC